MKLINQQITLCESSGNYISNIAVSYDASTAEIADNTYDSTMLLYNYIKGAMSSGKGKSLSSESVSRLQVNLKLFGKNVSVNESYSSDSSPTFVNLKMGW